MSNAALGIHLAIAPCAGCVITWGILTIVELKRRIVDLKKQLPKRSNTGRFVKRA